MGIPTVLDRFIQQALLQVLQQDWDATFSDSSYGFRPERNAHQATKQSQKYLKQGCSWIVDMDLEKFFDRVNHNKLMSEVKKRIPDKPVIILIQGFLRSDVEHEGKLLITEKRTPQGGPLSPLLANLMLDKLVARIIKNFTNENVFGIVPSKTMEGLCQEKAEGQN